MRISFLAQLTKVSRENNFFQLNLVDRLNHNQNLSDIEDNSLNRTRWIKFSVILKLADKLPVSSKHEFFHKDKFVKRVVNSGEISLTSSKCARRK